MLKIDSLWTRKIIFNTIVLPHFSYGVTISFLGNSEQKLRLELLQNRAMRAILHKNKYARIKDMLKLLDW